jgi:hypothetical protein
MLKKVILQTLYIFNCPIKVLILRIFTNLFLSIRSKTNIRRYERRYRRKKKTQNADNLIWKKKSRSWRPNEASSSPTALDHRRQHRQQPVPQQ